MTSRSSGIVRVFVGKHSLGVVVVALAIGSVGIAGCGVVSAVKKVAVDLHGNKAIIDDFTKNLKSASASAFEATYLTTGSAPTTVVYAVSPPKGLAFENTPSSSSVSGAAGGRFELIANTSGEYACTPGTVGSGSTTGWSCEKLKPEKSATENKIFDFYTPAHWVAFLQGFALAAGFAGDKVSKSSMTLNGFKMQCVDFVASGVSGTSTICTVAQGILGYVKVAGNATRFEITRYSTAPAASLFELPPQAKITTANLAPS